MSLDDIDALIRRYLATAMAVVVILVAPATGAGPPPDGDAAAVTGTPDREPAAPPPGAVPPGRGEPDEPAFYEPPQPLPRTTDEPDAETDTAADAEADTAAGRFGWGEPDREDDFTAGSTDWEVYDGPGHGGEGVRSPAALTIEDCDILVITGDEDGRTGGLAWGGGQRYGRWEGRVRAPASDPSYDALMLLWPDADDFPVGGEIDFMEMLDPTRQATDFFLHHGADNAQLTSRVQVDGTQWHHWAVEWTPEAITGYVDGQEWFRSTDPDTFPPGPMHLCLQLDWFPEGPGRVQESRMEVDWVRQWSLDAAPAGRVAPGG